MSKVKVISAAVMVLALGYGLWWVISLVWLRPANIDHFFTRAFVEMTADDPQYLSRVDAPLIGGGGRLTDPRPARREQEARTAVSLLKQLEGYEEGNLTEVQRHTRGLLREVLTRRAGLAPYVNHEPLLVPFSGVQVALPVFLAYEHPVRNRDEASAYIERLRGMPRVLDDALEGTRRQAAMGIQLPAPLLARTLEEVRRFLRFAPNRNPLYLEFARRAARVPQLYPGELNEGEAVNLLVDIESLLSKQIYPAYARLEKGLQAMLAEAPGEGGASRLPQGSEYYAYCLKAYAGTEASPDSLMKLGEMHLQSFSREVEQEAAFLEMPYSGHSGDFLAGLRRPDSLDLQDAGLELLADTRERIAGAIEQLPASGRLEIRETDSFMRVSAPAASYLPASLSDRRAFLFFNPRFVDTDYNWRLRALFFRYGVPGMHLQRQRQQEQEELPLVARTACLPEVTAGWGLYAIRLADQLGLYRLPAGSLGPDPLARMGYLQEELLQAARLVADPALHTGRWSREKAILFLQEKSGISQAEAALEVDRMLALPGRASAASVGLMELIALQDEMRQLHGEDFALQDFHEFILQSGGIWGLK